MKQMALGLVTLTQTKLLKIHMLLKSCSCFGHIDTIQVALNPYNHEIIGSCFGHIDTEQVALKIHTTKSLLLVWSY
jgi:hypothetical protein